ncbi:MAG: HupE/UreJ family protein [Gammaproteobacteria bacterium]|nr:HupE/UreJ family protein [Gammaproteobacteria bacterium]
MNRLHGFLCIVLFGVLAVLNNIAPVFAHDPGLSYATLTHSKNSLVLEFTFAQRDIETIVPMDSDWDGEISIVELEVVAKDLQHLMSQNVALENATALLHADSVLIRLDESQAIHFVLTYAIPRGPEVNLIVALFDNLSLGHRQYLTVLNNRNEVVARHILSADNNRIDVSALRPNGHSVFREYFKQGIWHIWIGLDHILFLVTLLLPAVLTYRASRWQVVQHYKRAVIDTLKVVTAFTVAHSITLSLAVLNVVKVSQNWIEPVIALSVIVVALNNVKPVFTQMRWLMAFVFGLVHGFGFASVLAEIGLENSSLITSLAGFNLGVEAGQLAIVMTLFPVLYAMRGMAYYRLVIVQTASVVIAMIALTWFVERAFERNVFLLS